MATLQELDQWGNLDSLDVYGNLEFLDGVAVRLADASVTATVTSTSNNAVTFSISGNVTGAASVQAIAAFIASYSAAPALSATSVGVSTRIRGMDAVAPLEASANGTYKVVFLVDGSAAIVATSQAGSSVIYSFGASSTATASAIMVGEILGEKWSFVDEGTETWTDYSIVSDTWTNSVTGGETWTDAVIGSEVWTNATDGTEEWNRQ